VSSFHALPQYSHDGARLVPHDEGRLYWGVRLRSEPTRRATVSPLKEIDMPEREVDTVGPNDPIETVGNTDLVASDRVEGTAVFGTDHAKIGHVHNFMVSKRTGQVAHVIISDGGFFGLGASQYVTVPWDDLTYHPKLSGYVAHLTKEVMQERGRVSADDAEMQIW
jgi:sporulation protein YlmC with PRC-barrel domain